MRSINNLNTFEKRKELSATIKINSNQGTKFLDSMEVVCNS